MIIELATGLVIDTEKKPYSTEGFQIFVGGKTGSGKSYTLAVLLENAGQFVYLDPHGEGHTLSELGDHVVVISERIGVPIHIDAIPIYIDILKSGKSIVLDISDMYFNDKKAFSAFSEAFIKQFRAEWSKVRDYILLVIDEAHVFAPQKPRKNEQERVDLFGSIASEGRKLGIMLCTATQRPALIDKTAISQANIRLVGKITKSHDFKAFEADIPKEEYESVSKAGKVTIKTRPAITFKDVQKLNAGEFYAITHEGVRLVKIHKRTTFDAGMTPEAKKKKPVLSKKQTLDSEEIGRRIKEAIEAAAQNIEHEASQADEIRRLQRQVEREKKNREDAEQQRDMVQLIGKKFGAVIGTNDTGTKVSVPQDVVELKKEFDRTLDELRKRYTSMEQGKNGIINDLIKERDMLTVQVKDLLEEAKAYMELGDALKRVVGYWDKTEIIVDESLEDRIIERVRNEFSMSGNKPAFTGDITEDLKLIWEQRAIGIQNTWEQRAMDKMKIMIDGLRYESLVIMSWLISESTARRRTEIARKTGFTATSSGSVFDTAFKAIIKTGITKSTGHGYSIEIDKFVASHVDVPEYDAANLKHHLIRYIIEQEEKKKQENDE